MKAKKVKGIDKAQEHAIALRCLDRHDHPIALTDPEVARNCGACVLAGYVLSEDGGPSHVGWARIYVEAGRKIPFAWRLAFEADTREQTPYGQALRERLIAFGHPGYVYPETPCECGKHSSDAGWHVHDQHKCTHCGCSYEHHRTGDGKCPKLEGYSHKAKSPMSDWSLEGKALDDALADYWSGTTFFYGR